MKPAPKASPPRATSLYRDAPARQLNIRLLEPLHQRYRTLLRELDDAGEPATMTELIHALLHAGPASPEEALPIVRDWRAAQR